MKDWACQGMELVTFVTGLVSKLLSGRARSNVHYVATFPGEFDLDKVGFQHLPQYEDIHSW